MKFLELKTENQLPSYPLFAKEGKPQGRGVLKRGLGGVKQLLAPCLLLLATLFAALTAWASAKTEDMDNTSGLRFEGGLDAILFT